MGKRAWKDNLYLLRNLVVIIWFAIKLINVRRIIVGNILNPWMKFLVSVSNCREVYVLDDGNATIPILKQNKDLKETFRIPSHIRVRKNILLRFLQRFKIRNEHLYFFTLFEHWNSDQTLRLIPNHLIMLKQFHAQESHGNEIVFIGSPLVEFDLIPCDLFHSILKYICSAFTDFRVIYFRHRTEKPLNFKGIIEKVPVKPVEYTFLEMETLPAMVLTFFSTAALTLHKIYGNNLSIVNLRLHIKFLRNEQYCELLAGLADYYRKIETEQFRIFDLDPYADPEALRSILPLKTY